jgi:hypothetical protein
MFLEVYVDSLPSWKILCCSILKTDNSAFTLVGHITLFGCRDLFIGGIVFFFLLWGNTCLLIDCGNI